jgi:hypothetical protein
MDLTEGPCAVGLSRACEHLNEPFYLMKSGTCLGQVSRYQRVK